MDGFLEAIEEYFEAKQDYQEKAKSCLYDRDYFLHDEKQRMIEAKKKMQVEFDNAVIGVIRSLPPR